MRQTGAAKFARSVQRGTLSDGVEACRRLVDVLVVDELSGDQNARWCHGVPLVGKDRMRPHGEGHYGRAGSRCHRWALAALTQPYEKLRACLRPTSPEVNVLSAPQRPG
jgi:hypothetical protein